MLVIDPFCKLYIFFVRLFQEVNNKLVTVYRALSLMGFTYDNQNIFDSAYVEYLKKNLIKSTRHLNVYRYPKIVSEFLIIFTYFM